MNFIDLESVFVKLVMKHNKRYNRIATLSLKHRAGLGPYESTLHLRLLLTDLIFSIGFAHDLFKSLSFFVVMQVLYGWLPSG